MIHKNITIFLGVDYAILRNQSMLQGAPQEPHEFTHSRKK